MMMAAREEPIQSRKVERQRQQACHAALPYAILRMENKIKLCVVDILLFKTQILI